MNTRHRPPAARRWMLASVLALAGMATAQPKPYQPAHGWIPTPSFKSPSALQKFEQASALAVSVKGEIPTVSPGGYTVPGPFDFVAYAKASPYIEKWHIHLVKQGLGGAEVLVQKFEGLVTGNAFSILLDGNWFAKHGGGKYAARGFLSQATSTGIDQGMGSAVGFEILVPHLLAKQAYPKVVQPVAKPFGIAASTSSIGAGAPGAAEPARRPALPGVATALPPRRP